MRIVVTEPMHFSNAQCDRLRTIGEVKEYHSLPQNDEELVTRLAGAHIAVVDFTQLKEHVIRQLPDLAFVSICAAGYDSVDVRAAREHGVTVSAALDYATQAVAEFTVCQILSGLRRVSEANRRFSRGTNDWSLFQGPDLASVRVGIIGCGRIGKRVIELVRAFGASVWCYARTHNESFAAEWDVEFKELDTLLAECDVISLHIPLNGETRGLLDERRLRLTKPEAVLVNTARGAVIDEAALLRLLREGHFRAVALDVYEKEPPIPDEEWFTFDRVSLTPHIAFNSSQAFAAKLESCIANIEAFVAGTPANVVN